jgi:Glycosyl transferase family 2
MIIAIALLALAASLDSAATYTKRQAARQGLAVVATGLYIVAAAGLSYARPGALSLAVCIVIAYVVVNLCRLIAGRSAVGYLLSSARHSSIWLGLALVALVYSLLAADIWSLSISWLALGLASTQLLVAIGVFVSGRRQLRTSAYPAAAEPLSDSSLPTITVAVPVRNEAGQLEACLTAILSSNYPKLEVLAFDDHSHDKTPDIIKSFAHAGVRFIRTEPASAGWLDKNKAYASLAEAASGEYILFCGADVRIGVRSLRQLAGLVAHKHKKMVAIMPLNRTAKTMPILQAMRYFWEMAPPRRLFNRPPVLSSCWIIERKALQRYGGFDAVKQSMSAEAHLAKSAIADQDAYSFLRGDQSLDIYSDKPLDDQRTTARLRRYPQVHRRPEAVLLYSAGQAMLLLGPASVLVAWWPLGLPLAAALMAAAALVLNSYTFGAIQRVVFTGVPAWRAYIALLPAVAADIWYLNQSMILYEFATVTWKGRFIARPATRQPKQLL